MLAALGVVLLCGAALAADSRAVPDRAECAALRAAIEDLTASYPEQYPRGAGFLEALAALEARLTAAAPAQADIDAFARLQRESLTANPLVSGHPILFVSRRQYKADHHNTETMFQTGEINTASFEGGAALKAIDFSRGGEVRTLLETTAGSLRDPEVHFDGAKVVFAMRDGIDDDYHICEINADGSGLRALTSAKGVTDIDPLYLPDGGIVFSSSREPKYCMCNRHIMCNLFRMDGDGANINQIGKSTLFEGHPALLPDGRIIYYRWEYVDRNFGDAQGLWTVYPDGTGHAVYWGNNTQSPGAVLNARAIPGTEQVLCLFSSCHDRPWGALAIVDRRLGMDGARDGKRTAATVRTWPADAIDKVGEGDWDTFNFDTFTRVTPKYEDPFPLSDKYFLCSRMTGAGEVMGVFLVDVFGNEFLLHAEGGDETARGCFDPMPLAPAPRPPAIPVRRDLNRREGYFYIADVYRGTHMKGVERGTVKSLRVVESPEKRFWNTPPWEGQGQEAPAMNWHDFSNKRILGTVPVAADGSAYFAVPSDTFVYFQLLDEKGMMVQSMRSGTIVQAGETQGCVGCHEERRTSAPLAASAMPAALRRPPDSLSGWHGPARMFSYLREVQPVFDRNCMGCHDYGGKAAKALNLAGDRDLAFNTSYNELWRKKIIAAVGAGPAQIQQARAWGSHASKLAEIIQNPHNGVTLSPEDFDRVVTWIDINAPYYPDYASAYPDNLAGRSPLNVAQTARLTTLTGVHFAERMGFSKDRGPQVCFDRPAMSPCLADLKPKSRDEYREALDIIQKGAETLKNAPRGEDLEGFEACPADQRRQQKYAGRQMAEAQSREAIRTGTKVYDNQ
jgi:hypothetical protein